MEKIISLQNPQIKAILKLKKAKERKAQNLILIEGRHEISLALEAGIKLKQLYICSTFSSDENFSIKAKEGNIIYIAENIFKKLSNRENPDGYLAVAESSFLSLEQAKLSLNPLIVVIEAIEKPGNLGAIMRTADAIKADLIIINEPKIDIFNPNVIRASLGTVFTNQVVLAGIKETVKWLKQNKIKSFATTPGAKTRYTDSNFKSPSAILVGAEHDGLSPEWLSVTDEKISIPMRGKIDSLNVSVSVAIVLFEASRQRQK